jgi:hypothetical protein
MGISHPTLSSYSISNIIIIVAKGRGLVVVLRMTLTSAAIDKQS